MLTASLLCGASQPWTPASCSGVPGSGGVSGITSLKSKISKAHFRHLPTLDPFGSFWIHVPHALSTKHPSRSEAKQTRSSLTSVSNGGNDGTTERDISCKLCFNPFPHPEHSWTFSINHYKSLWIAQTRSNQALPVTTKNTFWIFLDDPNGKKNNRNIFWIICSKLEQQVQPSAFRSQCFRCNWTVFTSVLPYECPGASLMQSRRSWRLTAEFGKFRTCNGLQLLPKHVLNICHAMKLCHYVRIGFLKPIKTCLKTLVTRKQTF